MTTTLASPNRAAALINECGAFCAFGGATAVREMSAHDGTAVPVLINEFLDALTDLRDHDNRGIPGDAPGFVSQPAGGSPNSAA
jgi:hypothetical protein